MNTGQLFREALALQRSLFELYYEASENGLYVRYGTTRIAEVIQRAIKRVARRRSKFFREMAISKEVQP